VIYNEKLLLCSNSWVNETKKLFSVASINKLTTLYIFYYRLSTQFQCSCLRIIFIIILNSILKIRGLL